MILYLTNTHADSIMLLVQKEKENKSKSLSLSSPYILMHPRQKLNNFFLPQQTKTKEDEE